MGPENPTAESPAGPLSPEEPGRPGAPDVHEDIDYYQLGPFLIVLS